MGDTDLHREFEAAGEEVVSANVILNKYERDKRALAEQWLKERHEARRQALTTEELYIARSAKEAAWSATDAAREAAASARSAHVVAVIAVVVACGALIFPMVWR